MADCVSVALNPFRLMIVVRGLPALRAVAVSVMLPFPLPVGWLIVVQDAPPLAVQEQPGVAVT